MTLEFIFNIEPVSKERPRFSTQGGFVRTHTAPKTRKFENAITAMATQQMYEFPVLMGQLSAQVVFEFKKPKKTSLASPKKDLDNLCKSLFDALNDVVYVDDTQIYSLSALKRWSDKNQIRLLLSEG
jgi:Holliday junction resolvase RusA-like endonuclease